MKCSKHPKYKGTKLANYNCQDCLSLYLKLAHPRVLPKPTKIIKSKKTYSRKKNIDLLD